MDYTGESMNAYSANRKRYSTTALTLMAILFALLFSGCQTTVSRSYQTLERTEIRMLDLSTGQEVSGYLRAGIVIRTASERPVVPYEPMPKEKGTICGF
jgi:hypothetical protein